MLGEYIEENIRPELRVYYAPCINACSIMTHTVDRPALFFKFGYREGFNMVMTNQLAVHTDEYLSENCYVII